MPAIQQKRVIKNAAFPEAKKAKVVVEDPVMAKVGVIAAALQTDSFVVPGTPGNREMLVAMTAAVLATPRDLRHAHQQSVADMLKEVFLSEEARWTQRVVEAEAKVHAVAQELAETKVVTTSADSAFQEKTTDLKTKMQELAQEVHVTRDIESSTKTALSELTDLEETNSFDTEKQEFAAKVKTERFVVLKEGSWEGDSVSKDGIKALVSFFKKIHVDTSLTAALPLALGRKPTERSEFDILVVSELELKLEARLLELAQKIESNVAAIAEKTTEKDAAEAALAAAKTKQRLSSEALLELKAEQKQRALELSQKQQAVIEKEFEEKAIEGNLTAEKIGLEGHQRILSDLTELLERCAPIPEVVVEEQVVEEATEVVPEPISVAMEVVPEAIQEAVM